jgi:hypothetical protein
MPVLVEEDGTGLPTANAFATVDEVDAILEVNPHSTWSAVDPTVKANLIMWATRLLIERVKWRGTKRFPNAGTPFPRKNLIDREDLPVTDDDVPVQVKTATAYLADYLSQTDPTTVNSASNLTELTADVVTLKFDDQLKPARWPVSVRAALYPIGVFSANGGPRYIIKC